MRTIARCAAMGPLRSLHSMRALAAGVERALRVPAPPRARMRHAPATVLATTLLLGMGVAMPAWGQNWTGAVSNDWFDGGNWSGGEPPASNRDAALNTVSPNAAVINGGNASVHNMTLGGGPGLTGALSIVNGGTLNALVVAVATVSGGTGAITVNGVGSHLTTNSVAEFGNNVGTGSLAVVAGGVVEIGINLPGAIAFRGGADTEGKANVSGAGSLLTTPGGVTVGRSGKAMLAVDDSGTVLAGDLLLGEFSGATGRAVVSGVGSALHAGAMTVGDSGSGSLNVEEGGMATAGEVVLGRETGSSGAGNIAGTGSIWTTGSLIAGHFGTGAVRVSDGGRLSSTFTVLGNGVGGGGGNVVTGAGSTWDTTGALIVGNEGLASLVITNGGTVASIAGAAIGNIGQGNVSVLGAGSAWNLTGGLTVGVAGTGYLDLFGGTLAADSVDVGGVRSGVGSVKFQGDGSDATIGELVVGDAGTGTLLIDNGGTMRAGGIALGRQAGSRGTLTVDDPESWLTHTGVSEFIVGLDGSGELAITAGGTAEGTGNAILGAGTGSGEASVTGAGAQWLVDGLLIAGANGSGTLSVAEGGRVEAVGLLVGNNPGGTGTATVDGVGSVVQLQALGVGAGGGGSLEITGGGVVEAPIGATVGAGSGAGAGAITVSGPGSVLNAGATSFVGYNRTVGTVDVLAGGVVNADETSVGHTQDAQGTLHVSGVGSQWNNSGLLTVGNNASGTLAIGEQGVVASGEGRLGETADGQGTATVDGPGSAWYVGGNLFVGVDGRGTLEVTAGGAVVTGNQGVIGYGTGSTGTVSVTGPDSTWTLHNALQLGREGAGELVIADGGVVRLDPSSAGAAQLSIASREGVTGTMTVTGAGSAWHGRDGIHVGYAGTGALTIENGGVVTDRLGLLGYMTGSLGTAVVRGAGSQWNSNGPLWVGWSGSGALTVEAGGSVVSGEGTLGAGAGSQGTATVSGPGSSWTSSGGLLIGSQGSGELAISGGGVVVSGGTMVLAEQTGSTGVLNLGAAAGAAAVAAGTLDVASLQFGAGAGTLRFNHTDTDHTFGTAIGGIGTIDHLAGTTRLTGASDAGGTLNVGGGTLRVEGTLGDMTTTVARGATLGGSGAIGGAVSVADGAILAPGASAGTLTLDALSLSSDAILDYDLGQAGVVGGGVNDLLEVGGDLTLDGTLDITDIGGFGVGVYRLVNYGGTLTDNGLELAALPTGSAAEDLFVQTAIDGQVNLVNSAGLVLSFWDGAEGAGHNNGSVDGGNGNWNADNGNWTTDDGALNGRWDNGSFAVFGGAGGEVELSGQQAVAGLQFMSGYTLTDGTGGALHIGSADSVVRVDPDVSATIAVPLTGAGGLVKTDTGTLVLSAENTYAGGTRIDGGTLQVSRDANLGEAAGALVLDGGTLRNTAAFDSSRGVTLRAGGGTFESVADLVLSGSIEGGGVLTKSGAGMLTLSGTSPHGGGTRVQSGTLRLDGSIGGATTIATGATLTGTGTAGSVDNAGTVAAGNSIGTLALAGDYVHRNGAVLEAEIEPGGRSDLLDIAGSATLEGGTVEVRKAPGQYAGGTRYTLVDAAGGVAGTFAQLEQDLPFLDLLLAYDANHVYLDVQRGEAGFDIVCGDGSFNQCQVAGALDRIGGADAPTPDLRAVLTDATTLDLAQAQAAFDTLSGEAHASLAGAMLEGHALYGQAVTRRLAQRREAVGADRLQGGAWARGYGMGSELDGDGNAHGAKLELYGLAIGADAWAAESWLVGASLNTLRLDADFRAGDGGEADAKNVALYTSVQGERGYVDAVASYAWWDAEVQRRIAVGDIARQARSDYGMHRFAAYVEAGLDFAVAGGMLQPLLGAEWSLLSTDGFRETGADDLDLVGSAQNVERTTASAGLRWSGGYDSGAWTFTPTAQLRWLHTFGDRAAAFDLAFAGAPEASYRVRGVAVPEDRGLLAVGLQASRGNLDLFLDLDYQGGDGFEAASFGAGARWRW